MSDDVPKVTDFGLAKFTVEYDPVMLTLGIPTDFTDLTLAFKEDFERPKVTPKHDLTTTFEEEVVLAEWKKRIGSQTAEDERRLDDVRQFVQEAIRQASLDLPGDAQVLGKLTQSGAIMGTPQYMAPEQAWGRIQEVGPSADIYSLGAIMYEMLTGRPPFTGHPFQVITKVRSSPPVSPLHLRDSLDPALEAICMKCLEKTVERRYQSMGHLADDVQRFIDGAEVSALREAPNGKLVVLASDSDESEETKTSVSTGTTEPGSRGPRAGGSSGNDTRQAIDYPFARVTGQTAVEQRLHHQSVDRVGMWDLQPAFSHTWKSGESCQVSQSSEGCTMQINLLNTGRRQVIAFVIVGLLILGGTAWSLRAFQNQLTVENHSGQAVSLLMIGVYG